MKFIRKNIMMLLLWGIIINFILSLFFLFNFIKNPHIETFFIILVPFFLFALFYNLWKDLKLKDSKR